MQQVAKLLPRGQGLAAALVRRAPTVELDWDVRQKSRFSATDSSGRTLGVFLPRGTVVRGGDVLVAEDGSLIRVVAAPQPVLRITACAQHGSPFDLTRAAYHLGNRHVPIELQPDHLKIEPDHVLAELLHAMHLTVIETQEAFEPEGGAYAAGGHGHHGQGSHAHDHAGHAHEHPHAPSAPQATGTGTPSRTVIPVVAAPTAHVHGPGCGHDHAPHNHASPQAHVHGPGCGHHHHG